MVQHLVSDWSLHLERAFGSVRPALIESAVTKGAQGPGPLLSQVCENTFCEQEVQLQQIWCMKVGKIQWMTSAPGKKDLKQTTVDTKSKPFYIPMIYGDLPVSLADWPRQFIVSTSFA